MSDESEYVLVPREPPYPKKHIAKGVRTVNGKAETYYLGWTSEGGGWHQWGSRGGAKLFDSADVALREARFCNGPWFNEPAKDTIVTELTDTPKAKQWRAFIAEAEAAKNPAKPHEESSG